MKILTIIAAAMGIAGIALGDVVLASLGFVGLASGLLGLHPCRITDEKLG